MIRKKERKVKTMVMRKIREILKKSAVAALAKGGIKMRRHGNVLRRLAAVGLTAIMLATQLPAVAFGTEIEETMEQESIESDTAGPEVSELEADEQVAVVLQ